MCIVGSDPTDTTLQGYRYGNHSNMCSNYLDKETTVKVESFGNVLFSVTSVGKRFHLK